MCDDTDNWPSSFICFSILFRQYAKFSDFCCFSGSRRILDSIVYSAERTIPRKVRWKSPRQTTLSTHALCYHRENRIVRFWIVLPRNQDFISIFPWSYLLSRNTCLSYRICLLRSYIRRNDTFCFIILYKFYRSNAGKC